MLEFGLAILNQKNSDKIVDPSGGANQTRVRAYNERLVLSLVRRHGSLPKSEIARRSGLTPQTVSVIMRRLEKDGLLLRGAPQRGRVGQPSIPMSLNPGGAFSIGVKVGRRSADLVLVDFLGQILKNHTLTYNFPTPSNLLDFAQKGIKNFHQGMSVAQRTRVAGIGVATPFELWNWAEKIGAPQTEMDGWRDFDFQKELGAFVNYPVFIQNDATAACGAELIFGQGAQLSDFVYLFIGTFIGGGIVLNHAVYAGRTGNAGAFGPMPTASNQGGGTTLIDHASIFTLETQLQQQNQQLPDVSQPEKNWLNLGTILDDWIDVAATHLANAIVASCALIDFEAAVIDGAFPDAVRQKMIAAIQSKLDKMDTRGIGVPLVMEGSIGNDARVLGGACQPLLSKFLLNQSVLFKEPA